MLVCAGSKSSSSHTGGVPTKIPVFPLAVSKQILRHPTRCYHFSSFFPGSRGVPGLFMSLSAYIPPISLQLLRFDELLSLHIIRRMDHDIYEVQRLYPIIYLACHIDHVRSTSTKWKLSSRDSSILAHLDVKDSITPRALASHLGVVASTLSAALTRLTRLGYIQSTIVERDRRRKELRLTPLGAQAMASTSVLDMERVRLMLNRLTPLERRSAIKGLSLLAKAARGLEESK